MPAGYNIFCGYHQSCHMATNAVHACRVLYVDIDIHHGDGVEEQPSI